MNFSVIKSEKKHHGKIFDLIVDQIEYPSGNISVREIAKHPGGAVVVPVFENGDVLLIKQYRYPIKRAIYEAPAGKLDHGEEPDVCAKREFEEETGYSAQSLKKMISMVTAPGFCTEILHIYLATGLEKLEEGQRLEEGEESISVNRVPLAEAIDMVMAEEIIDGKTIVGLFMADRIFRSAFTDRE